jgi:hypothetical protein
LYSLNTRRAYFVDAAIISGCVCPGETLSYECTVMESGYILWTGSAFNYLSSSNEIWFYHIFSTTYKMCNNGAIVARGLNVEGNNYTSQLNVTITPDTAGQTIDCLHYNLTQDIVTCIFSSIIPTITGLSLE